MRTAIATIAAAVAVGTLTAPTAHADPDVVQQVNINVANLESTICSARNGHQWPEVIDYITGKNGVDPPTVPTGLDRNTALLLIKASVETACPGTT